MTEDTSATGGRQGEATPADIPAYAPGEIWLDTTARRSDPVTARGIFFQPSAIQAPAMSAHLLVLYRTGRTLMTRRLLGPARREEVGPGDVSLQSSGLASEWTWPEAIDVLHLYIDRMRLEEVAGAVCGRGTEGVVLRDILKASDAHITHMGQVLVDEVTGDRFGSRLYVDAIVQQLCVHILRHYAEVRVRDQADTGSLPSVIRRRLEDYVEAHIAENPSLDALAGLAGLSPSYFSRLFRNSFGVPPHRYLLERRLRMARELLQARHHSIAEIAAITGFSDQSHLTRHFKRQFDLTPQQYRKG